MGIKNGVPPDLKINLLRLIFLYNCIIKILIYLNL